MTRTTDELISEKLDQILRILVVMATKDMKQREQIAILNQAGFQPKDVAELLGTSGNTVRVTMAKMKRNRKSDRRSKDD